VGPPALEELELVLLTEASARQLERRTNKRQERLAMMRMYGRTWVVDTQTIAVTLDDRSTTPWWC
jgi:hypothetical protein